jgi:membrane-associated PAP2 superfamily phosphatase
VRIIIGTLAAIAALATLAMLLGVPLDLQLAGIFYDPAHGKFLAATNPYVGMVRDHGYTAAVACFATVIAAFITRVLRGPQRTIPGHVVLFLVLSLALGPGLIVNGIFKEFWDRPRPIQVTEFGGEWLYRDWWDPRGNCERNCSFVSGEAASAAWMFAPAMLAPPQWRAAAFAGAAIFTLVISVSRMAAGAHFFSDVLFAVLLMAALIAALHRFIFQRLRL